MSKLTINGITLEVPTGITILKAAQQLNIDIPTFCTHDLLEPVAACRVCLVEVEGKKRLLPACATQVTDQMVVHTQSHKAVKAQESVMELLLVNHPLDCPVCDKGGECELQDNVMSTGPRNSQFNDKKRVFSIKDQVLNKVIIANANRCIQCQRCVRVCDEVVGDQSLGIIGRGDKCLETGFMDNLQDCDHCGNCIEVCPVGALMRYPYRYKARQWDLEKVTTVCPHCATGCQITADVRDNQLTRVRGEPQFPVNQELLCAKGRFGMDFVEASDRVSQPLLRQGGELKPVSWQAALSFIRERVNLSLAKGKSVGGLISARKTNEVLYTFQKLMRQVFRSDNLDSAPYWLGEQTKLTASLSPLLSSYYARKPLLELLQADTLVIIGCNTTQDNPVSEYQIRRCKPLKLGIASSRPSRLDRDATLYSRVRPGEEVSFVTSLAKQLQTGHKPSEAWPSPEWAALFKQSQQLTLLLGSELLKPQNAADILLALQHLILQLQRLGIKLECQFLFEHCNQLGSWDMGVHPGLLPGYADIKLPEQRARWERAWDTPLALSPGYNYGAILDACESEAIGILYTVDVDLLTPGANQTELDSMVAKLDLFIVQSDTLTPSLAKADVVLPSYSFAETQGTFTNNEGRIQAVSPFYRAPPDAKYDGEIFADIAKYLGKDLGPATPDAIFNEISQTLPGYQCTDQKPGFSHFPYLHQQIPVDFDTEPINKNTSYQRGPGSNTYQLIIAKSRFHSTALTALSECLLSIEHLAYIEVSEADAQALALSEGDKVTLTHGDTSLRLKAKVAANAAEGLVVLSGLISGDEYRRFLTPYQFPLTIQLKKWVP